MIFEKIKHFMTQDYNELPPEILNSLKQKYLLSLPEKFDQIEKLLTNLKSNPTKEDLSSLQLIIHKFAGNAGMFGFIKVTEASRLWDQKLKKMLDDPVFKNLPPQFFTDLSSYIDQIRKEFNL